MSGVREPRILSVFFEVPNEPSAVAARAHIDIDDYLYEASNLIWPKSK